MDLTSDPADRSCLYLSTHQTLSRKRPTLPPKFQFQDHISCLAAKKCLQQSKERLRTAKTARISKLFKLPDPVATAAYGTSTVADETFSSTSPVSIYSLDSDTNIAALTFMSDRSQRSPLPAHYIELATLTSPSPLDPMKSAQQQSMLEEGADIHLDSSSLQAIIRIHKSKTHQDSEQMCDVAEESSHKEETEQQL